MSNTDHAALFAEARAWIDAGRARIGLPPPPEDPSVDMTASQTGFDIQAAVFVERQARSATSAAKYYHKMSIRDSLLLGPAIRVLRRD